MTYEEILALMQQRYRQLTGFDPDSASDIGIRLRVLADQVAAVYGEMTALYRQVFPQTSTGEALDRHAQCRGLARKPALAAEGLLLFSREIPASVDITIHAGTLCATRPDPQLQFITTQDTLLPVGGIQALVPAKALAPGEGGNVPAGAVCMMISAAAGISAVTNPSPFGGGADEESDDALRTRLLDAYRNISNGANCAFYYDIAMQNELVTSAAVLPQVRGRGTVDVVIHCAASDEDEVAAALQQELAKAKEINVDVSVAKAGRQDLSLSALISPKEGYGFDEIQSRCAAALEAFGAELGVGHPLLRSHLTARLLEVDGVYNVSVVSPDSDVHPPEDTRLEVRSVSVQRMSAT